ncbi:MAG: DUF4491 family protein [Bacteroidales bacterium]|nr:DUF4491 family protein [Bacteroidales bacterium]
MTVNPNGIIIGAAVFICIGIFHPLVIKFEYRWGRKAWWCFLALGLLCTAASLFIPSFIGSTITGAVAFSCFWSIHEMFKQEKRVLKGWFPENPARHEYYESKRRKS